MEQNSIYGKMRNKNSHTIIEYKILGPTYEAFSFALASGQILLV